MISLRDISIMMFIIIQILVILHLIYSFKLIYKFSKLIEKIELWIKEKLKKMKRGKKH